MVNVRGILITIMTADSVGAVQVGVVGQGALRPGHAARQRRHLAPQSKLCRYITQSSFYFNQSS